MSATPCGDAGAYALGALSSDEAAAFERHLEGCVVCREELQTFDEVIRVLPDAAPQVDPPRSLKRDVMSDFRAHERAQRMAARGDRGASTAGRARRRLPGLGAPGLGLAAGGLATVAVVFALVNSGGGKSARTIQARVFGPGSAQLRVSSGHAELVVRHMPEPAAGHIYEVWLERGTSLPAPTTALFGVTTAGDGDVAVPGDLSHVSKVLVTQEPAGGTPVPTTSPVIVATVS
jgi:anti-sigma-K factor RskA